MFTVVSASLGSQSKSRVLANLVYSKIESFGEDSQLIDLEKQHLPFCDGEAAYEDPKVKALAEKIALSEGFVLATPIYNYDVNAALKNFVELLGSHFRNKPVGLVAVAGGRLGYMAPLGLLNSLMLDYRSVVLPRYVYATEDSFEEGRLTDPEIEKRVHEFTKEFLALSIPLSRHPYESKELRSA